MNRLATLSLNNRSFIALVCIAVSIIGVFIMTTMRQELIPSVSLPQIQVMTTAPGSSSEQVQDRITGPVEQSLSGLENVEGTSSTSEAGVSIVTVELTYGTDVARSSNQVDAALSGIEDDLPEDADPQVMAGGTSDLPAVVLSVSSDLDPSELSSRLESSVTPELERVSGVSSVAVIGAPEEIVRITRTRTPWPRTASPRTTSAPRSTRTASPCPAAPSWTATAPSTSCSARASTASRASSRSC